MYAEICRRDDIPAISRKGVMYGGLRTDVGLHIVMRMVRVSYVE